MNDAESTSLVLRYSHPSMVSRFSQPANHLAVVTGRAKKNEGEKTTRVISFA